MVQACKMSSDLGHKSCTLMVKLGHTKHSDFGGFLILDVPLSDVDCTSKWLYRIDLGVNTVECRKPNDWTLK